MAKNRTIKDILMSLEKKVIGQGKDIKFIRGRQNNHLRHHDKMRFIFYTAAASGCVGVILLIVQFLLKLKS